MRDKGRDRGLTIIELLVASGLLAMVLVTVMTLFGQLLRNTEKNALLSAGTFFADTVLEKQIGAAMAVSRNAGGDNLVPAFPPGVVEGEGKLSTADNEARTRFLYRVETERLDPGSASDPGQLWSAKIEVRWYSADMTGSDTSRAGYGNLSVKKSRMVYIPGAR